MRLTSRGWVADSKPRSSYTVDEGLESDLLGFCCRSKREPWRPCCCSFRERRMVRRDGSCHTPPTRSSKYYAKKLGPLTTAAQLFPVRLYKKASCEYTSYSVFLFFVLLYEYASFISYLSFHLSEEPVSQTAWCVFLFVVLCWKSRFSCFAAHHDVRGGQFGEEIAAEYRLALSHHRRGSQASSTINS